MDAVITVSTDGSCLRNPGGASGWAWVNHDGSSASGGIASGTNQVAELQAVLEAILAHPGSDELRIESDSQYAIKCASEWVAGWKRKGWRTASGSPVKNLDLVKGIERAMSERAGKVVFHWVRGHQGDHFNERADVLAGTAARAAQRGEVVVTRTDAAGATTAAAVPAPSAAVPVPALDADLLF
ncbi:ribonuclease H [Sanguibacter sp. 25GB23B1]|uniref:ribonuclease H family protein n=1 Tax=unclassified Sanguibacter TaxID=2645534 RepID=UPI0032AF3F68